MSLNGTDEYRLDSFTGELLDELFGSGAQPASRTESPPVNLTEEIDALARQARENGLTTPIVDLFNRLKTLRRDGYVPGEFGLSRPDLVALCEKHRIIDEHGVTLGGRVNRALPIVEEAASRVKEYLALKDREAPSGIEMWEQIKENTARIKSILDMSDEEWGSYPGQIKNCIDSVEKLSAIIDLPANVIRDIGRVTETYRMRMTPYYASLIQPDQVNDPILLQAVPTGEMVDNVGVEIPPVASDHSPARLIDQFYPRVLTIKVTNMCAMYCTHCLRIAHIGKKDRIYTDQAYEEAFDYIRSNTTIRDILITGGDSFVLPNEIIRNILESLDRIDHVRVKRIGTRIPVTAPMRVDRELLDILAESNEKKPVRVVTQINTAREITPASREAFKKISSSVSAVLNQAVLLKGINDTRVKMWKLCETIQDSYVRPYYLFNCSYRNPQFKHLRVPIARGRDIVESMYGNISGDAIPRYIAPMGGKIPLHKSNVQGLEDNCVVLTKPWNGETVHYPDAENYEEEQFAFKRYQE
ncbi:MAG: KamA family radical SAM protein [bacterium]|nr:KamA family radical SAM protein [bacterium]